MDISRITEKIKACAGVVACAAMAVGASMSNLPGLMKLYLVALYVAAALLGAFFVVRNP